MPTKHKECQAPKVWVLVRTEHCANSFVRNDVGAESDIIGVYRSERQAEKAKRQEIAEYDACPGEELFRQGSDCLAMFHIFQQTIHEDESDDEETEEDESDNED